MSSRPSSRSILLLASCLAACGPEPTGSGAPGGVQAPPAPSRSVRVASVLWPSAAALDARVRGLLPVAARERVSASRLPVLVPGDPELARAATVTTGAHFTAVSCRAPGLTVSLHSTSLAYRYDAIPPLASPRRIRDGSGFVTSNERIWTASWIEGGVAHALDIECGSADDARCADERAVLELAARLAYVGGAGADHEGRGR